MTHGRTTTLWMLRLVDFRVQSTWHLSQPQDFLGESSWRSGYIPAVQVDPKHTVDYAYVILHWNQNDFSHIWNMQI